MGQRCKALGPKLPRFQFEIPQQVQNPDAAIHMTRRTSILAPQHQAEPNWITVDPPRTVLQVDLTLSGALGCCGLEMSVVSSWPSRVFEAGILCRDGSGLMYIQLCDGVLKLFSYSAGGLRWCHETPPPDEVRRTSGDNSLVSRSSPWHSNVQLKFHSDKSTVGTRVC